MMLWFGASKATKIYQWLVPLLAIGGKLGYPWVANATITQPCFLNRYYDLVDFSLLRFKG